MRFESFIASRILKGKGNRISRPIVNITSAAITVGIALMILSLVVLDGFQSEIRNKVIGFGSHITIIPAGNNYSKESSKFVRQEHLARELRSNKSVKHVQSFAIKPGILETDEHMHGVLIKGISSDFDAEFFNEKLLSGRLPNLSDSASNNEILLSKYIANRILIELDDKVTIYFVQNASDIKPRKFKVVGIYETGLEEFDEKYVFVNIRHIQKISGWGLEAQIKVGKQCNNDSLVVEGFAFGGDGDYQYSWEGIKEKGSGPYWINPKVVQNIKLIITDHSNTLADTAQVQIELAGINNPCDSVVSNLSTTGGSYSQYIGGYEVLIDEYKNIGNMDVEIFKMVPMEFQTQTITQQYPEIFNWLEMLDINVYVIIGLMIFIALINMTSAVLIIILEKTRMIGIFKAFGSKDRSIIKIFLRTSLKIIGRGILLGNILGIGIALLQYYTGFISLNPSNYFVDKVPISINWISIIALNIGTVLICMLFLILPAFYVTRIDPVKAIKLD